MSSNLWHLCRGRHYRVTKAGAWTLLNGNTLLIPVDTVVEGEDIIDEFMEVWLWSPNRRYRILMPRDVLEEVKE